MSLSPFSRDNRPLQSSSLSTQLARSKPQPSASLTLSQALIITAGLAGLIGLLSGGIMRFSLSRSSNARFLSPLQTFPTLANRSSTALPISRPTDPSTLRNRAEEDALNSWGEDADLNWETGRDFGEFSSEGFTEPSRSAELENAENLEQFSESAGESIGMFAAPSNFDSFANRVEGRDRIREDPLKSLSQGPLLRKTELDFPSTDDAFVDDESFFRENLSEERF